MKISFKFKEILIMLKKILTLSLETTRVILSPLIPSSDKYLDLSKLIVISSLVLFCFLYFAGYVFPGGAVHYTNWASVIVDGGKLPLTVAQREVGLPILYILTGFTKFNSFIGPTVAYGLFGIFIVLCNYLAISLASKSIAYLTSLILIISFAPFSYIKFFYPDQLYIFVIEALLTFLIFFIWTNRYIYLYLFSFFAIYASLTRTSGNLLFFALIFLTYVIKRNGLKHYLFCLLIGVGIFGLNQYHRYDIFDLKNQVNTKPVGKGYQILYSTYMWMGDFGYKLSPDLGPNTKLLLSRMHEELSPSPRDSQLLKNEFGQTPPKFMEEYMYKYSTEELIEKVISEPGEEYFYNIIFPIKRQGIANSDTDDEFQFEIVKEIWTGYPLYIIKYGLRNLFLILFDPGWSNPRYSKAGFIRQGLEFVGSAYTFRAYSTDSVDHIGENAVREQELHQFRTISPKIQSFFISAKEWHVRNFRLYVYLSSIFIIIGWILCLMLLILKIFRSSFWENKFYEHEKIKNICLSIFFSSIILLYENIMTALFSQPHFRYFHITEAWRFAIIGFSIALMMELKPLKLINFSLFKKQDTRSRFFLHYKKIFFIASILFSLSLITFWVKDIFSETHGTYQFSFLESKYVNTKDTLPIDQITFKSISQCTLYKCTIEIPKESKLYSLSAAEKWQLEVKYQCKNIRNPNPKTAYAKFLNEKYIIEYDCYPN